MFQVFNFLALLGLVCAPVLGADLIRLRLDKDGSVTPPGDRLALSFMVYPEDEDIRIVFRPLFASKKLEFHALTLPAAKDALPEYRGEKGELRFLATAESTKLRAEERNIEAIFPYTQFQFEVGRHQVQYEVEVSHVANGERVTDFKAFSRTTVFIIEDGKTRDKMIKAGKPPEVVYGTRKASGYVVKPDGSAQEVPVDVRYPQASATGTPSEQVPVQIPGVFEREEVPPPKTGGPVVPVGIEEKQFVPQRERRVFYATNRNIEKPDGDSKTRFGNRLSDTTTYGDAYVQVPIPVHRKGNLETKGWFGGGTETYFYVDRLFFTPEPDFYKNLGEDDVLLYVHGFQNSFDDVLLRAAQIQHDLEFPGNMMAFSWPSQASSVKYGTDEEMAESPLTTGSLSQLLLKLSQRQTQLGGKGRIHIIAHSMGSRVLLLALSRLAQDKVFAANQKVFGTVVFAAPDVGVNQFASLMPRVVRHAERVSFYYSLQDMALGISAKLHTIDRAGLHPFFYEGMETICVDNVNSKSLGYGHAYYSAGDRVLLDLNLLIKRGLAAQERRPPLKQAEELKDFPGFSHFVFEVPPK